MTAGPKYTSQSLTKELKLSLGLVIHNPVACLIQFHLADFIASPSQTSLHLYDNIECMLKIMCSKESLPFYLSFGLFSLLCESAILVLHLAIVSSVCTTMMQVKVSIQYFLGSWKRETDISTCSFYGLDDGFNNGALIRKISNFVEECH